tara:strand:- start:38 stop:1336 length:1299 start_codon:yes stop_codon:yes gene_type:complete
MQLKVNNRLISFFLIFISIFSFFLGFYFNENSAGAGSYNGDILTVWKNLQIFLSNDLISSIEHKEYITSRTPIVYLFHEIFNPLTHDIESFRLSVLIFSLLIPILFFYCLKQKFVKEDNLLLLLISSTILLSPYFRTSAYWGLEENFGIAFLLLSFLFLNNFLNCEEKKKNKIHIDLIALTFFSSCSLYFDQKLIFIPLICLFKVLSSDKLFKFKFLSIFYYFLFSLPYFYLIMLWGGLIPSALLEGRKLGNEVFLEHIGYLSTIIAFYLLPLLLFKGKYLASLLEDFFKNKQNYYLIFLFGIYLFYMIGFYDFENQLSAGKGFIHKISLILFSENIFRMIFVYFSFFASWIIILIYFENKLYDILILFYLFILSIFLWPMFQEYFDPLILLLVFTFFTSKVYINYKNSIILFVYLSVFLSGANVYYLNLLN